MLTEDITIPKDGSWTEVTLTSTITIIYNDSGVDMMVRFGASSTSNGIRLSPGDSMSVDESIYIRPSTLGRASTGTLKVSVTR